MKLPLILLDQYAPQCIFTVPLLQQLAAAWWCYSSCMLSGKSAFEEIAELLHSILLLKDP